MKAKNIDVLLAICSPEEGQTTLGRLVRLHAEAEALELLLLRETRRLERGLVAPGGVASIQR